MAWPPWGRSGYLRSGPSLLGMWEKACLPEKPVSSRRPWDAVHSPMLSLEFSEHVALCFSISDLVSLWSRCLFQFSGPTFLSRPALGPSLWDLPALGLLW